MLALSVPAMAQDDNKATIDAITKVIKSKPADLEDQVKAVYKKNKKNEKMRNESHCFSTVPTALHEFKTAFGESNMKIDVNNKNLENV